MRIDDPLLSRRRKEGPAAEHAIALEAAAAGFETSVKAGGPSQPGVSK